MQFVTLVPLDNSGQISHGHPRIRAYLCEFYSWPLCSRLRPDVCDRHVRQTDRRQTRIMTLILTLTLCLYVSDEWTVPHHRLMHLP